MRKHIVIDRSERLHQIPSSLFVDLQRKARRAARRGVDVIDLTMADPQEPPSPEVVDELCRAAREQEAHRYDPGSGLPLFRQVITDWLSPGSE
jgi:LL-diaminopimelate aminotransferase